jgi:hypothetical protein
VIASGVATDLTFSSSTKSIVRVAVLRAGPMLTDITAAPFQYTVTPTSLADISLIVSGLLL